MCYRNFGTNPGGFNTTDGCGNFTPTRNICMACGCHRNFHMNDGKCFKNHAASSGNMSTDSCFNFVPSFACIACGCHPNFHRLFRSHDAFPWTEDEYHEEQPLTYNDGDFSHLGECCRNITASQGTRTQHDCPKFIPTHDYCITCGCHKDFHDIDGICIKDQSVNEPAVTTFLRCSDACNKFVPSLICANCFCHHNFHKIMQITTRLSKETIERLKNLPAESEDEDEDDDDDYDYDYKEDDEEEDEEVDEREEADEDEEEGCCSSILSSDTFLYFKFVNMPAACSPILLIYTFLYFKYVNQPVACSPSLLT